MDPKAACHLIPDELPDRQKSRFTWFLIGVIKFVGLDLAAH
jgi:hypothetical protein